MITTKNKIVTKKWRRANSKSLFNYYDYFNNYVLKQNYNDKVEFIERTEEYVRDYLRNVSNSQIRKLHGAFKSENYQSAIKLIPLLMYIAGKEKGNRDYKDMITRLLIPMIKKINDTVNWENFQEFFTSILAFHKYYAHN